jgi:hypothetical protein
MQIEARMLASLQTFLNTGLYNWYMLSHMHPKDIADEHRQVLMQRSMILVSRQTMKAALQVCSGAMRYMW